ncbi:hypothetical protein [Roseisolibacter agri]|uniref:Uncharacterized protein n=1 Tax=Roseisolibacter agri TaxID=2014610 RepID=A0AA37VER9_9BACT|nr:hypothetical protein [Roseisolibacter agri]GLC25664.1 hypothetical protein rosag_21770 [Roseisolibacter agri]
MRPPLVTFRPLATLLLAAAPLSALRAQPRPPADLHGAWQCMRSVATGDPSQRMLTFDVRPGGVWIDRTTRQAITARYAYARATGTLRLQSAGGALLYTLRWTPPGDGGSAERLVEQVAERTRAGEVCYRAGSATTAAAPVAAAPAPAPAAAGRPVPRPGGDPFNKFAYPVHLEIAASTDGLPADAVFSFTITPAGGAPFVLRRTTRQLLTSPAASHRVPLDETATLLLPGPGRYRVTASVAAAGRETPLQLGYDRAASVELTWGPSDTYLNGGRSLMVLQPE